MINQTKDSQGFIWNLEDWEIKGVEGWKIGGLAILSRPSNLLSFQPSTVYPLAALIMPTKPSAFKLAPPTSAPSISD
jgi:hypothetical protein